MQLDSTFGLGVSLLAVVVACETTNEVASPVVAGVGGSVGKALGNGALGVAANGGSAATGSGATGGYFPSGPCGGSGNYAGVGGTSDIGTPPPEGGAPNGEAEGGAPNADAGAPADPDPDPGLGEGGASGVTPDDNPADHPITCSEEGGEQRLPESGKQQYFIANDGVHFDECAPNGTLVEYYCEYAPPCDDDTCAPAPTGAIAELVSVCDGACVDGACVVRAE
jgi:hypothetical protein